MPAKTRLDYKKTQKELYLPSAKSPVILDIPEMKFFMIDGRGNPNTSQEYKDAVTTLYAVSYALKMKVIKKTSPGKDYVVPPLEGLWYMDDMSKWSVNNKDEWLWTSMIRIPDFITESQIQKAIGIAKETKDPPSLNKLQYETYKENTAVQILYLGKYSDEGPTIQILHEYAKERGYTLNGKHHEIYLSDPRRIKDWSKCKTVIRQPISHS